MDSKRIGRQSRKSNSTAVSTAAVADPRERADFVSRLIGWAEALSRSEPLGHYMSPHRLRHSLSGSSRVSELADALLQFESRLSAGLRGESARGPRLAQWREQVLRCSKNMTELLALLDALRTSCPRLRRRIAGRRGVCGCCSGDLTADLVRFCAQCCHNFHHGEGVAEGGCSDGGREEDGRRVWLCRDCHPLARPQVETPARKRSASVESADSRGPPVKQERRTSAELQDFQTPSEQLQIEEQPQFQQRQQQQQQQQKAKPEEQQHPPQPSAAFFRLGRDNMPGVGRQWEFRVQRLAGDHNPSVEAPARGGNENAPGGDEF